MYKLALLRKVILISFLLFIPQYLSAEEAEQALGPVFRHICLPAIDKEPIRTSTVLISGPIV